MTNLLVRSSFGKVSKLAVFALFATLLLWSCRDSPADKQKSDKRASPALELDAGAYNVAFLIMDGVYNTELTAPFDIFHHTRFRKDIRPILALSARCFRK